MRIIGILSIVLIASLVAPVFGQGCGFDISYARGNGQSGNMFDVVAQNPLGITVTDFALNLDGGAWNIEIYIVDPGAPGAPVPPLTHVGREQVPNDWTMIAAINGVISAGVGNPTPLNAGLSVAIPAGAVQAFYVTVTNGTAINYTNGLAVGNVWAGNADLDILEGTGNPYPFAAPFAPRNFNGSIFYTFPGQIDEFEQNKPGASLTIDGATGGACMPTVVNKTIVNCTPPIADTGLLRFGSNAPGAPFDILINSVPVAAATSGMALPLGAFFPGDPQVVNVNIFAGVNFLSTGGPTTDFPLLPLSLFPGATSVVVEVPFQVSAAGTTSLQGFVATGITPSGLELTQATQIDTTSIPAQIAGPVTDDGFLNVSLADGCLNNTLSSFNFYGQSFSDINVFSNGRVAFGGLTGAADFSATVAEAMSQEGAVGCWTDFSPNANPATGVTITGGSDTVTIAWANVPYFGPLGSNSFSITLDLTNDNISISGLSNIDTAAGQIFAMWLGISPGSNGLGGPATDNGIVANTTDPGTFGAFVGFAPGDAGVETGQNMLYDFWDGVVTLPAMGPLGGPGAMTGAVESILINGVDTIDFAPQAGNYNWIGS